MPQTTIQISEERGLATPDIIIYIYVYIYIYILLYANLGLSHQNMNNDDDPALMNCLGLVHNDHYCCHLFGPEKCPVKILQSCLQASHWHQCKYLLWVRNTSVRFNVDIISSLPCYHKWSVLFVVVQSLSNVALCRLVNTTFIPLFLQGKVTLASYSSPYTPVDSLI